MPAMPEVQSVGLNVAQDTSFTSLYGFDVSAAMSMTSQISFIDSLVSNWNGNGPETMGVGDVVWPQDQIAGLQ
jgi:hypothetical protein